MFSSSFLYAVMFFLSTEARLNGVLSQGKEYITCITGQYLDSSGTCLPCSNAISNSGFETPTISGYKSQCPTGWSCGKEVIMISPSAAKTLGGLSSSGQFIGLKGINSYVKQVLTGLTVGLSYDLFFYSALAKTNKVLFQIQLWMDGRLVTQLTPARADMMKFTVNFVAKATSTTIQFSSGNSSTPVKIESGDYTVFLDNIHITCHA